MGPRRPGGRADGGHVLGSDTEITDQSGSFRADFLYYPWDNWTYAGNMVDAHFAGFQQGAGPNYRTSLRLYSGAQGRWLSPDPLAGELTNPQSLNRYVYAVNNPTTFTDPLGLDCRQTNSCPPGYHPPSCYGMVCADNPATYCGLLYCGDTSTYPGPDPFDLQLFTACDSEGCSTGLFGGATVANGLATSQSPEPGSAPPPEPQAQAPQQNVCTQPVLNAVNNQFGTNFTPDNVQLEFPNGGATNLNILGNGLPAAQFNSIQTGRYPLSPLTWLIGYGPTLHVTGRTFFDPTPATFQNGNIGGVTSVLFTAHIDTSFAYNPIGALIHVFRDLLHIGGPRKPC